MVDTAALAALIVAAVALVVAAAQLTQQLMATAYVIRKCDQIVTGGITKGGTRQWHWRQFRFTVRYQAVVFALPQSVYESLGISSTIRVNPPTKGLWDRALETRSQRSSTQACWISLLQDLVHCFCLSADDICTREESGDRIPDDLTVAPTRVDCLTVLLSGIAMGMQVFKYSPTTGEVTLGGGVGSISSSIHPVLGGLLHYSVFADDPAIGFEMVKRHGSALHQKDGIWANAVFGRFRDRSYRPEMISLQVLWLRKIPILQTNGWPLDRDAVSNADTIWGAACFMVFGHIDAYMSVPPSVVRPWCAHFAEVIVKAHHIVSIRRSAEGMTGLELPKSEHERVHHQGFSTPYTNADLDKMPDLYRNMPIGYHQEITPSRFMLLTSESLQVLKNLAQPWQESSHGGHQDPSSYCPPAVLWDCIWMADNNICALTEKLSRRLTSLGKRSEYLLDWVDRIVARFISTLSTVGAVSWGNSSDVIKNWPHPFYQVFDDTLGEITRNMEPDSAHEVESYRDMFRLLAELSLLRSAYYTVLMRAAHPIGPGLTKDSSIETALAYMT